jgi:hypothetical protein
MRIKLDCTRDERFIKARRVNAKNIFTELKRRNVYRAAVAYRVVAWFLTQLTTQVFPFFEIPNSAVRFVVIAVAAGFPIAMLLSWLYEFTPFILPPITPPRWKPKFTRRFSGDAPTKLFPVSKKY